MNMVWTLLLVSLGLPAFAATYTIPPGASASAIQAVVNQAGASPGNTVMFSKGSYNLAATLTLPCSHGTIFTGPSVGVVTQANLPTAILSSTVVSNYALSTDSNSTSLTGTQGCTIQYLRFSGTQGGILLYSPSSGITIQENAFDNDNPPQGGNSSMPNIWVDGENSGFTAELGAQHITIVWNTFFSNCANIRAVAYPDAGGGCAATWVNGYNNYLTWSNNTVNLTEEGLKLSEQGSLGISSLNAVVENNNLQGASRIQIESQMDTNGAAIYSHNAFYQPFNPSYNDFGLSIPEWTPSISPTHVANDNVFIGNVPVTLSGSGGHYGIGLELWGAGSIAKYNLFQGGNGPDTCAAGFGCTGWGLAAGGSFTNAEIEDNYFSGADLWSGSANNVNNAVTYEDGASSSNAGINVSANTVVQTSTTIATVAPVISSVAGSSGSTISISDSDVNHGLSFFYTTDGSTPAIFGPGGGAGSSRVYVAPFAVAAGATVKAIASWGQGANQGIRFPVFGYVPSSVVTRVAGTSGRALVSAYLGTRGSQNTMVKGGTLQFTAYGIYSDGSVATLPDAQGYAVTAWNTSSHATAKVSSQGHVTAVNTGTVNIEAMIGSLKVSPWTVTIRGTAALAVQAAAAAPAANAVDPAASLAPGVQAPAASDASAAGPAASLAPGMQTGTAAAGPIPLAPGAALPDTFLGPFWRVVTPAGGSASISTSHLFLGVPGGSNHDPLLSSNQAVRVVQSIGNQNFDVAIKIDSPLFASDANTSQGLMVLSDNANFITFALATDGTRIGLSAHTVAGGAATTVLDDSDFSQYQNPMYLRMVKNQSAYVGFYSLDGINWTQATSFTDTQVPKMVGPFASNYNDTPANAVPVVMSVNWFDVLQ